MAALWENTIDAIREVADHNPAIDVSIEYKPNEPRSFSLMPDVATTLLAIRESTGPISASRSISRMCSTPTRCRPTPPRWSPSHSRLLGVHLNDGYGKRDDGLMVGAVHPDPDARTALCAEPSATRARSISTPSRTRPASTRSPNAPPISRW